MLFSMKMQVAREVDKHTDTAEKDSIAMPAPQEEGHESKLGAPSISTPGKPIFYKSCINLTKL